MRVRCPHCRHPIEVVDSVDDEIPCPTCGSTFRLISDDELTLSHSPDTRPFGRFQLLDEIGAGAFGSVWKAHDPELDRKVALKLPRHSGLSREDVHSLLREARAAAQLNHPNIVTVHEVGRDERQLFIVSELVEGVNLAERLLLGRLSFQESVEIVKGIAGALEHAHRHGVIHRDLKPSNIMLTHDLVPLVMDFGLAKRESGEISITVDGKILVPQLRVGAE